MLSLNSLSSASIIETIREPLLVVDSTMHVIGANPAFYNYFTTNHQDTIGSNLFDVNDGQWQNDNLKQQLFKVRSTLDRVEDFELELFVTKVGKSILLLNIYPLHDDNTTEHNILITINDITRIRTESSALEKKITILEENNNELSSFSYIASHDLQDPLRKIHTFGKMILDDKDSVISQESAEYLARMLVSTKRMQQLTEDLLNYSHISTADTYQLFDTNLKMVINESIDELSGGAAIDAEITVSALPVIRAVPVLVRQLFINLIGNAIKYSKKNTTPVITIDGKEAEISEFPAIVLDNDRHERYYKVTITDNGIGFSDEQAVRIFDPFYRLHSKDKYEGSGIGLAICKKIMTKHKGFITAESSPGNGTTFTLLFPL